MISSSMNECGSKYDNCVITEHDDSNDSFSSDGSRETMSTPLEILLNEIEDNDLPDLSTDEGTLLFILSILEKIKELLKKPNTDNATILIAARIEIVKNLLIYRYKNFQINKDDTGGVAETELYELPVGTQNQEVQHSDSDMLPEACDQTDECASKMESPQVNKRRSQRLQEQAKGEIVYLDRLSYVTYKLNSALSKPFNINDYSPLITTEITSRVDKKFRGASTKKSVNSIRKRNKQAVNNLARRSLFGKGKITKKRGRPNGASLNQALKRKVKTKHIHQYDTRQNLSLCNPTTSETPDNGPSTSANGSLSTSMKRKLYSPEAWLDVLPSQHDINEY